MQHRQDHFDDDIHLISHPFDIQRGGLNDKSENQRQPTITASTTGLMTPRATQPSMQPMIGGPL